MKRRSFLAMLGLAPVAAVPAAAAAQTPNEYLSEVFRKTDAPFTFENGTAHMNMAHLGLVNSGAIRNGDGSFAMDLGAGSVSWFS